MCCATRRDAWWPAFEQRTKFATITTKRKEDVLNTVNSSITQLFTLSTCGNGDCKLTDLGQLTDLCTNKKLCSFSRGTAKRKSGETKCTPCCSEQAEAKGGFCTRPSFGADKCSCKKWHVDKCKVRRQVKDMRSANLFFDPLQYPARSVKLPEFEWLEELMGFEAGYLNSAPEGAVRAKMLGNAVHIGVISHLLRPLIATLPTTRRWVVLSLFNGIDGFLLGLDQAAESVRHAMTLWTLLPMKA